MNYAETYNPLKEDGRMTSRTKKDASTHQNISEVKPLTPEEVDEMLLHDGHI